MRPKHLLYAIRVIIVAGLASLLVPGGAAAEIVKPLPVGPAGAPATAFQGNPRFTPVVHLVKQVRDSVVNIHSERSARRDETEEWFALTPSQNRVNGMGTGIIIDPRGYIITNHHVVEGVNTIRIRLADGASLPARIVARDAETDLALLKVDHDSPLPVIPCGTASDLMVGETVVAVGNAYGYHHTVTVGVVSAIKRDVTLNKDMAYKQLVQTDAAINPGNSGGPLLNINGDLIGVNVAIRAGAQGIGFAIPVDNMLRVAADMLSARRRLGLTHGLVCTDKVETPNGRPVRELVVGDLEAGGPAARAGVQKGDVIVKVGGAAVACRLELERAFLDRAEGEAVPVELRRNGQVQQVKLALEPQNRSAAPGSDLVWRRLGVKVDRAEVDQVTKTNGQLHGGLKIEDIRPDSVASKGGLQKGDILVGLHQWEMLTIDNVLFVLNHPDLASFNPLRFYIIRAGQVHRGWLQTAE